MSAWIVGVRGKGIGFYLLYLLNQSDGHWLN